MRQHLRVIAATVEGDAKEAFRDALRRARDEKGFHASTCPGCGDSELIIAPDGEEECVLCGWNTAGEMPWKR